MADKDTDKKSKGPQLPEPWANPGDSRERHIEWVSDATDHRISRAWRPWRGDRGGIVVRLESGHEVSFETITEASRPDRFINAFTAIDGVVMSDYTVPQVRRLVGALIRIAAIGTERDEREEFTGIGADFLRGCLAAGDTIVMQQENSASLYSAGRRFLARTSRLRGDGNESWPPALHATDTELLFLSRRLFAAYVRRSTRGAFTPSFQMPRCGWTERELQPYPPKTVKGPRLKVRVWEIPEGWEGITVAGEPETPGDGDESQVSDGDAETHRDALYARPHTRAGTVLRSSARLHVSEGVSHGPEFYAALRGDTSTSNEGRDAAGEG